MYYSYFCRKQIKTKPAMEEMFQKRFRIPSARASWHNYREGMYFITICTHQQKTHFGRIIPRPGLAENQLVLTEVGRYAERCIHKIETLHPNVSVPTYQIMPNHIHLLIIIGEQPDIPRSHDQNGVHNHAPTVETSHCGVSKMPSKNIIETPQCDTTETPQCDVSTGNKRCSKDMRAIAQRCGLLSYLMSQFKSAITKYARERGIAFAWQTRFYDRIVRNQNELNAIVEYIENNPYK